VSTNNLTLASGADINVSSIKDLTDLTIIGTQVDNTKTNSYSVSAPGITAFESTVGLSGYLIKNVTDETGLNFTFQGDKTINVGTINVMNTSGGAGITEPVVTLTSTAGQINDDINDSVVDITATKAILTGAGGIGLGTGDIDLSVDILNAASTNADINLTDTGDLMIDTVNAGVGNVKLIVATGAIKDDMNDAVADITAGTASLTAKTGIGTTNANGDIDLNVKTVLLATTETGGINQHGLSPSTFKNIKTTDKGDIILVGDSSTTFQTITSKDGKIDLTVNGGLLHADTITAQGSGDIFLTTKTSGNIEYQKLLADGNRVYIHSAGTVTDLENPTPPKLVPDNVLSDVTGLGGVVSPIDSTNLGIESHPVIEVSRIPSKTGFVIGEGLDLIEDEGLGLEGEEGRSVPSRTGGKSTVTSEGEAESSSEEQESPSDIIDLEEGLGLETEEETATSSQVIPSVPPPAPIDTEATSPNGSPAADVVPNGGVNIRPGEVKEEVIP